MPRGWSPEEDSRLARCALLLWVVDIAAHRAQRPLRAPRVPPAPQSRGGSRRRELEQGLGAHRWAAEWREAAYILGCSSHPGSRLSGAIVPAGGRTGKQCRERWLNHVRPGINFAGWTDEEEAMLVRAHMEHGNRWKDIAKVNLRCMMQSRRPCGRERRRIARSARLTHVRRLTQAIPGRTENQVKNHVHKTLRRIRRGSHDEGGLHTLAEYLSR